MVQKRTKSLYLLPKIVNLVKTKREKDTAFYSRKGLPVIGAYLKALGFKS